jgi:imidazolonepropionase-like amidohydrolase
MRRSPVLLALVLSPILLTRAIPARQAAAGGDFVLTGAHVVGLPGQPEIADAVIVARAGKIVSVGAAGSAIPSGGARTDAGGRFVMPGLISAHSHISDVNSLQPRAYTEANTMRQLALFARYGITTVWSLGGEQAPAFRARDTQDIPSLTRARVYVAGDVVSPTTVEQAREQVAAVAALRPDVIKIRVDDNLGTSTKMPPEVYRAVIDEAHTRNLRVAAHIFYLEDAKDLLRAGVDMIAHSVRDREIDDEFIALMKARDVPYCPTLARELSTFVYESTPAFFADPFFLREVDHALLSTLTDPARQQAMRQSASAQGYKAALPIAQRNLKKAADAGILIAMGTDSGPSAERFEGYFEHLEMAMMADAGLAPATVLHAATLGAARAMRLDTVGVLRPGAWADLVLFDRDPREDIRNTRSLSSVWIAGNPVQR